MTNKERVKGTIVVWGMPLARHRGIVIILACCCRAANMHHDSSTAPLVTHHHTKTKACTKLTRPFTTSTTPQAPRGNCAWSRSRERKPQMRTSSLYLLLLLLAVGVCLLVFPPGASPAFAAAQEVDDDGEGVDVIETLLAEADEAAHVMVEDVESSFGDALEELDAAAEAASSSVKETLKQGREKVVRAKKAAMKEADSSSGRGGMPLDSIVERLDKLERRVHVDEDELGYSLDSLEDDNKSMLEMYVMVVISRRGLQVVVLRE